MVMTASTMLALGTALPDFKLPDVVSGTQVSPSTFKDNRSMSLAATAACKNRWKPSRRSSSHPVSVQT